jgi:hypothetical protein
VEGSFSLSIYINIYSLKKGPPEISRIRSIDNTEKDIVESNPAEGGFGHSLDYAPFREEAKVLRQKEGTILGIHVSRVSQLLIQKNMWSGREGETPLIKRGPLVYI